MDVEESNRIMHIISVNIDDLAQYKNIKYNGSMDKPIQRKVDGLIKKSIEYAFANYPELNDYIRSHSQEMSEEVMRKHIDLYVNDYSLDLGEGGKAAIHKLLEVYQRSNQSIINPENIFIH